MASSPDERESLSGGESFSGYGAAPWTRGSFNVGVANDAGYCEATEEDEERARVLTRGLGLDVQLNTFVKLQSPDDVAVIVPHTLHFGDVEHLDYTATVQDALAVQTAGSPVHRPRNGGVQSGTASGSGGATASGTRTGFESHPPMDGFGVTHTHNQRPAAISGWLVWVAIMVTGLSTGLVSVVLTNISTGFGNTRLQETNALLELNRPLAAASVWVTFSVVFTTVAAYITVNYAPQAASTGTCCISPSRRLVADCPEE
jgi:hypothetical protein